jgi:uncharacterized protein (TIGR01615 family)
LIEEILAMPGVMSLRPVAASGKTGRRTSRLTEKLAEERGASTNFKAAAKVHHPIMMPVVGVVGGGTAVKQVKQVTDPWPEDVKERLVRNVTTVNYSSSGSEHEPSSNCLVAMVHEFMEKENELKKCGRARCNCEGGSCGGDVVVQDDDSKSSLGGELCEVLQTMAPCVDEQEVKLLAEVVKVMDVLKTSECATTLCRRRSVMKHLRSNGYNAALCKSRWDHAGSFPGGDYEYIDVISSQSRLIVDIDFQSQFEIARPSSQYKHVYQALPPIYVGTTDRLLQILNVMTEAVKRSLKKKGMFLPPWRKPEYVKAKWFSSYKRTTNESSSKSADSISPNISLVAVRSVDWDKNFTREMEDQFEGAVRGANNLKQLWTDMNTNTPREIQEVDNMDWQPPELLPKTSTNRRTGLTLALREAGLIGSTSSPVAAM